MTEDQVSLIRHSFGLVRPIADQAAALFYARLFEIDPGARSLFERTDMAAQGRKLMAALSAVVDGIDRPSELSGALSALARRHVRYGVQDAHYASVGAALLWTLERGLGPAFTEPVRAAWTEAYGTIAGTMTAAAHEGGATA